MKIIFISLLLPLVILSCSPRNISHLDSKGKTIVCFGDSLTEGYGVNPGEDFPSLLGKYFSIPVINSGQSGETTRDAIRRIDRDVLAHNPKLVIIEFGANDFFKQIPKEETLKNMEEIVSNIHKTGAMTAIAIVKVGLIRNRYKSGFEKIAKKYGSIIIPDVMKDIINNPKLKYDGIHPNAEGYKIIAEQISERISPYIE